MWRVGHDFQEKKSASTKPRAKPRRIKDERREHRKDTASPRDTPKYGSAMMNPISRQAPSSTSDFLKIKTSGIRSKLILDENPNFLKERRFSNRINESRKLSKVKEIQEKIDRVISYYDDGPKNQENSTIEDMLNTIEVGLHTVDDDMLRINISSLIGHHRILQRFEEDRRQEIRECADNSVENQETLSALQHWLDQDHLEDLNTEEIEDSIEEQFNKNIVHEEITQIKGKMHKLVEMKHRIHRLKTSGDNTYHLERQRDNLHEQMKSEVKRLRIKKKSNPKSKSEPGNTEYDYLKNATKEVYQLIQKTKLEGMAQANQFEKQLKKILKEMADAKSEIDSLQDLVSSQREQIKQWSKDYDKLHNELMITVDERNMARDDSRNLRTELLEFKQKILSAEVNAPKEEMITKAEHKEITRKLEKALRLAKQNLIVVGRALDEKEKARTDLTKQCNRLKRSLRKESSISLSSDSDYHSSSSDLSNVRSFYNNSTSRDNFQIYSSSESLLNPNSDIIYALKKEVEQLREKLQQQQQQRFRRSTVYTDNTDLSHKQITTENYGSPVEFVSQETQTQVEFPISVYVQSRKSTATTDDNLSLIQEKHTESVACQTSKPRQLPQMTHTEQVQMSNACRTIADKVGDQWLDIALKISNLEAKDVEEISRGLAVEDDFKKMFSGSTGDPAPLNSSITKVETIAEKMLRGESPSVIETQYKEQDRHVREQVDEMRRKVSYYVSGIKEAVNNQAAVMNVVNQEIQSMIGKPAHENQPMSATEEIKTLITQAVTMNSPIIHQTSDMRIEMPMELSKLNPIEQANCKMELIEKTLCNLINQTKEIYSTEVEREHQNYKNICNNALSDNVPEYPVKEPNVERKLDTIKEKVIEKVSEASSKVMPKSTARVILKSHSEPKPDPDEPSTDYPPVLQRGRSIFHLGSHDQKQPMNDISSLKGSRMGVNASTSKTDQKKGVHKIISGQFWQYTNQPSNNMPIIESTNKVKKSGPLVPINEEPSGVKQRNQSIYEKYGKGLGFSRMFNKNRNALKKPNELGLLIQTSSFKQSTTPPPMSPVPKKTPLMTKDTATHFGRMDRARQVLPYININDRRRTQGAFRSGGIGTLGDFRLQSFKAAPLGGAKNDSKPISSLTSTKFPFMSK